MAKTKLKYHAFLSEQHEASINHSIGDCIMMEFNICQQTLHYEAFCAEFEDTIFFNQTVKLDSASQLNLYLTTPTKVN